MRALDAAGLPVPPTIACQDADSALQAFDQLGGDVVLKPLFGSEGRGMIRLTDPETACALAILSNGYKAFCICKNSFHTPVGTCVPSSSEDGF